MIIKFVTSNKGKVLALQNRLGNLADVEQMEIDLPEIQANNAREIAEEKARIAFEKIKKPLMVQDSSFHIEALGGFPGPYIKYINQTIGPEGILKLMADEKNRNCHFELALVYVDKSGNLHTFENTNRTNGKVSEKIFLDKNSRAWSPIWRIYIPAWSEVPLAACTEEKINKFEKFNDQNSEFFHFVNWFKNEQK